MKNIIVQIFIKQANLSPVKEEIFRKAVSTVERYAKNVGSDYVCFTERQDSKFDSHFEVFRIIKDEEFREYNKVLYVDADVFARDTNESLFDLYDGLSACKEYQNALFNVRPEFKIWGKNFLNSGVLMFNQNTILKIKSSNYQELIQQHRRTIPGRDQLVLNLLAHNTLGGWDHIDRKHVCFLKDEEGVTDEIRHNAIMIHLAGRNRDLYLENAGYWDKHFNA